MWANVAMRTEYIARWKHTVFVFIVITLVLVSGLSSIANSYGSESTKSLIPSSVNYLGMSTGRSGSADLGIPSFSAFSVTISPTSATIDIGQSVDFSVTTNQSSLTYNYVWYLNGNPVGTNNSTYTFDPSSTGTNSVYVNVTNAGKTVKSSIVTATVDSTVSVSIFPGSEKVNVGTKITFTATPSGGTGSYSYAWYLNGTKTSTTTSTYYLTPTGNATYYVNASVTDTGTINGFPSPPTAVSSGISTITAVFKTYFIIFEESGLPANTRWYANLTNGQTHSAVGNSIPFGEPNGTYTITIATGNKVYTPSQSYFNIIVNGNNQSFLITFNPVLYSVTFTETGLPLKTIWYVNITGQTSLSSSSDAIVAKLYNDTYSVSIATGFKEYYPTPFSENVQVNGKPINVSIVFSKKLYPVEFSESGLPANTEWFLRAVGNATSGYSNDSGSSFSPTITLNLPNGTYGYNISSGVQTFGPSPSTGNFTVSGNAVSEAVRFLRLYQITFVETGLPIPSSSIRWYLNISNTSTLVSSTDTVAFWEPNQTYSYSVSASTKWYIPSTATESGSFTVSGSNINGPAIVFNELMNVTFEEEKLPSGNTWYVNVSSGGSYSSSDRTISFVEINGTYSYVISSGNKLYRPNTFEGSFVPNSSKFPVQVIFVLVTYGLTFSETGLTNGTFWSITINNLTRISTNESINFKLNNGSYEYSIQSLSGFSTTDYLGNVTVNGSSLVQPVKWIMVTYPINITQSGITSGKQWSVTLQGNTFNHIPVYVTINTTKSFVIFHEPNGTYNYTIHPPFGYTGSHVTGVLTIYGKSASAVASLVPPNFVLIGIIGAIAVGILGAALALSNKRENRSLFVREGRYVRSGKYLKFRK